VNMLDVSISAWRAKWGDRQDSFAPLEFEETPAVRHPSESPPSFTDTQRAIIDTFAALIPAPERAAYLTAVDARFGPGAPGTGAVKAACIAAAKAYLSIEELRARGLAPAPTRAKKDEAEAE
jgi:hypothetical protein